jgi:hypothetical protein
MLSSPEWRAVAADARMESRALSLRSVLRWVLRINADAFAADAYADAYAANANADAYAYVFANADAYVDVDAYATAAYAYADADAFAADADADASDAAYATAYTPIKELEMRNGLYAAKVWSGNLMVLRVGWFRHEVGDDFDVWWTVPYRGEYQTRLSDVWVKGPNHAESWTWGPVHPAVANRLHTVVLAKLDPKLWAGVCPRPKEMGT